MVSNAINSLFSIGSSLTEVGTVQNPLIEKNHTGAQRYPGTVDISLTDSGRSRVGGGSLQDIDCRMNCDLQ